MKNRQFEIMVYLLKVKKTTHRELASRFEVSLKTIQRDIDQLSMLGVPIICKQGNQGGIYLTENYKLDTSFFTKQDLHVITFALSMFDSVSSKKKKSEVLNKLALISPESIQLYENDAEEYFVVDLVDEEIDLSKEIYRQINICLDEEIKLEITFNGEKYEIAPISYVLRKTGLFLYAFEKDYWLIKIDEIEKANILKKEFERAFLPFKNNDQVIFK